jgi:signal transduction histidine kinase
MLHTIHVNVAKLEPAKLNSFLQPDTSCLSSASPRSMQKNIVTFIHALAHEVRNPLCTIKLAAELLNQSSLDEEQREFADIIIRGSERIKELINNLLVSARSEETAFDLYSMSQLLEEALIMTKDRMLLKNITVSKQYTETECSVRVDKEKMKIALINIIINAIDAMPSEGGELKLITKSTCDRNTVEIQDNGIGISKEHLKSIFKPYFTNKAGGIGLGLSVTLDILRANDAFVDVRSEEGAGTSFILSFDKMKQSV